MWQLPCQIVPQGEIQGTGNLAHAVAPESQNISKLSKVEFPERQPGLPYEFHSSLSQQQGPPHGIPPIPCRNTRSCTTQLRNSSPAKTTLHARIRNSLPGNIDTKNCSSPIACQKTQNRLPKSGSGVSGFRGSNLTKTMASLQGLESFEPLNPLTPDPDFGNLFCVFRQAIGKLLFAISFCRASYWEIQHRAGPQICSLLASYRKIAHNAENDSYSLVYCCKYNCLLGIALPQKTFLKRFYKPKKPFEKSLRAPMEDQRDQRWDCSWFEG